MYTGENWVIYQNSIIYDTNDKLLLIVVELGENVLYEKNAKHYKRTKYYIANSMHWAILTPSLLCRHFYLIAVIKCCGRLSNPFPPSFVHVVCTRLLSKIK